MSLSPFSDAPPVISGVQPSVSEPITVQQLQPSPVQSAPASQQGASAPTLRDARTRAFDFSQFDVLYQEHK